MAKTRAVEMARHAKGTAFLTGKGYKGVKRKGSKFAWEYQDGRTHQSKGGYDSEEEAAYGYDEFLISYVGPDADTNQALGLLKLKDVLQIREKISKAEKALGTKGKTRHVGKPIGESGYKGVSRNGKSVNVPWRAQINVNRKQVALGSFTTKEAAARAYDAFVAAHCPGLETNVQLGLLPPLTEPARAVSMPPRVLHLVTDADEEEEDDAAPYQPFRTPEQEREEQRLAALAMPDIEEEEEPVPSKSEEAKPAIVTVSVPAPTVAPVTAAKTDLIVMTDADKLRARAEAMLREAAELDAGNIKKQAALQIDVLTRKLQAMQAAMLTMIDTGAEIELELHNLKELLK